MKRSTLIGLPVAVLLCVLTSGCGGGVRVQQRASGPPPQAAAEMQRRMGSVTGPSPSTTTVSYPGVAAQR